MFPQNVPEKFGGTSHSTNETSKLFLLFSLLTFIAPSPLSLHPSIISINHHFLGRWFVCLCLLIWVEVTGAAVSAGKSRRLETLLSSSVGILRCSQASRDINPLPPSSVCPGITPYWTWQLKTGCDLAASRKSVHKTVQKGPGGVQP